MTSPGAEPGALRPGHDELFVLALAVHQCRLAVVVGDVFEPDQLAVVPILLPVLLVTIGGDEGDIDADRHGGYRGEALVAGHEVDGIGAAPLAVDEDQVLQRRPVGNGGEQSPRREQGRRGPRACQAQRGAARDGPVVWRKCRHGARPPWLVSAGIVRGTKAGPKDVNRHRPRAVAGELDSFGKKQYLCASRRPARSPCRC